MVSDIIRPRRSSGLRGRGTQRIVDLHDVTVHYRSGPPWARHVTTAVRGVTLQVSAGETLGLVGESGSGKTTIGRVALGLERPASGVVTVAGAGRRRRGELQAVFQQPDWSLNPRLRVGTSVAEPLAICGVGDRAERRRRAVELLQLVGMDGTIAGRFPHELSGGQRQRAAIARALVTEPRFILFDEVVTALDVSAQAQILNLVRELQAARGFAAIFISHDLGVVRYVADRVGVLYRGELLETTNADALYADHPDKLTHPYSRELLAAID